MTLNEIGFLAISRGDFQEAANIFRKSFSSVKNATAYYGFGLAHFRLEDFPTARWAFHKTLELSPEHQEAERFIAEIEAPEFDSKRRKLPPRKKMRFRVGKGCFEVWQGGKWKKLFIKGINLGLGLPGHFPGEYSILKKTYLKWFEQMSSIGINAVRIYAVHPPSFYEALDEWNRSGKTLYLFQGIWMELPEDGNYSSEKYLSYARANIREAVDIIHGNTVLPHRPGHPEGKYTADVSWCTMGFMFGREWEPDSVKHYNELNGGKLGRYDGRFLEVADATPFEVWITRVCDFVQQYENERYGITCPCSTINWPSLDPLTHPSESLKEEEAAFFGKETYSGIWNEDMESLDVARIRSVSGAGFFAVYHAYPYYPDFMNNDYLAKDEPYLAYLKELKAHHGDQPIVIAEFGVPSSQGDAHSQRDGWNHGGHNCEQQGEINALQMKAIHRSGMAGGMLFSWFDEWFKKNWVFYSYYIPPDRKPLWFNMQDPEENYGLLAAYPGYPSKKVTLTGNLSEWKEARVLYEDRSGGGGPKFRFGDGGDDARTLVRLRAQHDEGFFYLLLETKGAIDFEKAAYAIGINTCTPDVGEFLLPFDTKVKSPVGLQFLVHLAGEKNSRIMAARNYDRFLNFYRKQFYPVRSDEGAWVSIMNHANSRRVSKDKSRFFPAQTQFLGRMIHGSLDSSRSDFNSLADFRVSGNLVELRIYWSQLNFSDPSSRSILWLQGKEESRKTEGIRAVAVSYRPRKGSPAASRTGGEVNAADIFPRTPDAGAVRLYTWDKWEVPIYHMYPKKSFDAYKKVLSGIPEEM